MQIAQVEKKGNSLALASEEEKKARSTIMPCSFIKLLILCITILLDKLT